METSRLYMPLLTELGRLGNGFFYKHVAPNGAPALQRELFNRATWLLRNLNGSVATEHVPRNEIVNSLR